MSSEKFPVDDSLTLSVMQGTGYTPGKAPRFKEDGYAAGLANDYPHSSSEALDPLAEPAVATVGGSHQLQGTSVSGTKTCRKYATIAILLLVNLLNYMDRFTIAGVLEDIQKYYNYSDSDAGLLQTSFIVSYMIFSPMFGYLGDRYNRKILMCIGIVFWSCITLAGSFIPANVPWLFTVMRGAVGIGEASYSTIAPTIIADMYVGPERTLMLSIFYFAIPVGSGLGYIVGAYVAKAFGAWQWALRVTPLLGILCVILLAIVVKEPVRGEAEGSDHSRLRTTSIGKDVSALVSTKSFVLSTFGFTCVTFVTGALAFFAPNYMFLAYKELGNGQTDMAKETVALIFGVLTCVSGFIGVAMGGYIAKVYKRVEPRADPLVCAFGVLGSMPFLYIALVVSSHSMIVTWVLIFIGETLLALNWAIITDILLYVVVPTRRSTAEALQIFFSHLLGDAGSPYLVGLISDALQNEGGYSKFISQQYSLYITAFVCVLGGCFFLFTALYVVDDKRRATEIMRGMLDVDAPIPPIPDDERQLTDNEFNDLAHPIN